MRTGIFLNKEEQKEIKRLVEEAKTDGWGLTVNEMSCKGNKTRALLERVNELAIKYGLPDKGVFYGLSQKFEILK